MKLLQRWADALRSALRRYPRVRLALSLSLTVVACALLLTDVGRASLEAPEQGEVATRDVVSTVSFSFIDENTTAQRQAEAAEAVLPVYQADLALAKRLESRVSQAFDMARRRYAVVRAGDSSRPTDAEELSSVQRDFVQALEIPLDGPELSTIAAAGYAVSIEDAVIELLGVAMRRNVVEDRSILPNPPRPITLVQRLGEETDELVVDDYSPLRTPEDARQAVSLYVLERFSGSREAAQTQAAATIARALVRPTVTYDAAETTARRQAARDAVRPVELQVRRGTRIIRSGDVVTEHQIQMVEALREAYGRAGGRVMFGAWLGFSAMVILSALAFARETIKKFASRPRDLEAMALTLVLVLASSHVLAAAVASFIGAADYDLTTLALLVPVAGGAMVVRVLVNSESALVWAIVASVLCAAMMDQSVLLGAYYLVTALAAAGGVGQARERLAVLRSGLLAGLLGSGMVLLMLLVRAHNPASDAALNDWRTVLQMSAVALGGGILSASIALGTIPVFELLGFTTDYKLLELANLNHPLLRQLMLRAPGTYHHSVIVGSLSEAACEAVGANALLARVACYFHDIGKGLKPQYFVENQRETPNRHDRLTPTQSAQVIINHVRDGGALAVQHNLPRPVADQIFMHHGTGIIQYFYTKAQEQAEAGETVDEALFRYPGPKPDSREAGVIMLADKVEAACRTIKEPTETRIRAMIQQITNSVMVDGQFERCPLTLKELYTIADSFTTVLLGIYHHRIEYPATAAISSGRDRPPPVPRQGTITLEIMNPLRPPPAGSGSPVPATPSPGAAAPGTPTPVDYEAADQLPGGRSTTLPIVDDS